MAGINLVDYEIVSGWTPLALIMLAGISLNFLGFGVVGEYVGRIFEEVKNRPHYLIRNIDYGKEVELKDRDIP